MTPITKESLIEFGMIETGDGVVPMKKVLSLPKEEQDNTDEDCEIAICVSYWSGLGAKLCLSLPDGATIWLAAESIEDLQVLEKLVASWEPVY